MARILVITDLIMPEREGSETILDLRANHPEVNILVISGGHSFDRAGPLQDAEALGAHASLAKPFELSQLLGVVNDLLGES